MKLNYSLGCILAVCLSLTASAVSAQQTRVIEVLLTFDYPGEDNSTLPQKINDPGDISGHYVDSSGITRGFIRFRNGTFSEPIVDPNGDGFRTEARAINNSSLVGGLYLNGNFGHGFLLSGGTFTDFDIPGALNTYIYALNDAGEFAGEFDSTGNPGQAYVNLASGLTVFAIPDALVTIAFGMNNAREIAGNYVDSAGVNHGFFRDSAGSLTFPIDFPGASSTIPFGINDRRIIVGRYTDASGVGHGFVLKLPAKFMQFDFPGAVFTSLNGINRQGVMCGRYDDGSGFFHGFVARISQGSTN